MATISVKLKVIADNETKLKIEKAHIFFNEQVRNFEKLLLLARANDYYYLDENGVEQYKSKEEAEKDLDKYLAKRQGIVDIATCKKALAMLEDVIISKGSQAAGMLTKLYNKDSSAGTNNITKIVEPEPEWVKYYDLSSKEFADTVHKKAADDWIESEKGQKAIAPIIGGSGRPSAFKQAYLQKNEWYFQFIKDQNTYRKDLKDGLANMLSVLESNNALPILDVSSNLYTEHPVWVKLYLKTALENFASYIACDTTTRENYKKAKDLFFKVNEEIQASLKNELDKVDVFLKENYFSDNRNVYLTERMCRGFSSICIAWSKCKSYEERIVILNEYQAENSKEIGDANFLRWVAKDENQSLIKKGCIDKILEYYNCLRNMDMKRKCASYTVADPINSKRYMFYENITGSNYKKYKMEVLDGIINVVIPIITKDANDNIIQEDISFKLATNRQFRAPEDINGNKNDVVFIDKSKICFTNGKKLIPMGKNENIFETFTGTMGGADIRVDTNGNGKIKNAYMSITLTVDDKNTADFRKLSNDSLYDFSSAYDGKISKRADSLAGKTIRALSIDLGLKQFGAAAVGQILYDNNKFGIQDYNIERMFMLRLDGEKCSSTIDNERLKKLTELRELKTDIKYISFLKRIYNLDDLGKRSKLLKNAIEYTNNQDKRTIMQYCIEVGDKAKADDCLKSEYDRLISEMNIKMKSFRSGDISKKQKRQYAPGKSMWSIGYLENLRKIIMAWNSLGYHIDDDNNQMDAKYGVTATRLLEHINNIKDDRIKTGADLIIQAANGYVYEEKYNCWVQKYKPCNVIVFEDLSRYRFKSDRPRQENSKLMQWSHREIIEEVKRQAEIYGIAVYDSMDAAYSSKFYHISDAPGIRCDRLSKNDFDTKGKLNKYVVNRLPEKMIKHADKLKVGSLVPSEIGSIFVTLNDNNELVLVNADMNAACNLQKRFWRKQTHLHRIATVNESGVLRIKSDTTDDASMGKREKGKYLFNYGNTNIAIMESETKGHFNICEKKPGYKAPEVGEVVYNLFNDASGLFFDKTEWVGYKEFWDTVSEILVGKLVELL